MRIFFFIIVFIFCGYAASSQSFLKSYKKQLHKNAEKISNTKSRKKIIKFHNSHIKELDTIFRSYQAKTGFDFNTADSLFLIYYNAAESPYISDMVIIWSGGDTISYAQGIEAFKRTITYTPLKNVRPNGIRVITEQDSLMTLVANKDFNTISHLGDNQSIIDGSIVTIYVAHKRNGRYEIESCFPKKFMIPETWRPL